MFKVNSNENLNSTFHIIYKLILISKNISMLHIIFSSHNFTNLVLKLILKLRIRLFQTRP